jgi:tRNA1Val (adenine37-N6)-methyltransferase
MSNTYFQFKQFTIHQERCAMKVCTDACLFGAWVGNKVERYASGVERILDIGAGTGLLSLMLAQKTTALIDAIELDEHTAEQAAENFEATAWKERLQVIQGDARLVHLGRKYDLVISNPPFFENDLKTEDSRRNLALHSASLSLEELLTVIKKNLAENGRFAVLLPYHRKKEFEQLVMAAGFNVAEEVSVKQTPAHPYFRAILICTTVVAPEAHTSIFIRDGDEYSSAFINLLKDYYLKL